MYSLIRNPLLYLPLLVMLGISSVGYGEPPRVQHTGDKEVSSVRVYFGPNYRRPYWRYNNRPYVQYRTYPYYPYYYNYPYNPRPYYWNHRGGGGFYFRVR